MVFAGQIVLASRRLVVQQRILAIPKHAPRCFADYIAKHEPHATPEELAQKILDADRPGRWSA